MHVGTREVLIEFRRANVQLFEQQVVRVLQVQASVQDGEACTFKGTTNDLATPAARLRDAADVRQRAEQ